MEQTTDIDNLDSLISYLSEDLEQAKELLDKLAQYQKALKILQFLYKYDISGEKLLAWYNHFYQQNINNFYRVLYVHAFSNRQWKNADEVESSLLANAD